jgi:hypothetical protein
VTVIEKSSSSSIDKDEKCSLRRRDDFSGLDLPKTFFSADEVTAALVVGADARVAEEAAEAVAADFWERLEDMLTRVRFFL